jgi:hypothetical protein
MQRARAIELRATGMTYAQIGAAMGISRQAAAKHVAKALDELDASTMESARRLRRLESMRLDAVLRASWPKRDQVEHARIILEVSKRRAQLEGLDAPERREVTGKDGAPLVPAPEPEVNVDHMTDEQLAQLAELLRLAGIAPTPASQVGLEPARPALPPARSPQVEVRAAGLPRAVPHEPLRASPKPVVKNLPE